MVGIFVFENNTWPDKLLIFSSYDLKELLKDMISIVPYVGLGTIFNRSKTYSFIEITLAAWDVGKHVFPSFKRAKYCPGAVAIYHDLLAPDMGALLLSSHLISHPVAASGQKSESPWNLWIVGMGGGFLISNVSDLEAVHPSKFE